VRPEGANHQWRKNPPGELSIEFKTIQQAAPMFKEADLAYFDENRDGRVSRNEFVSKPNPLFARYDKNGDCKVTPAELKATSSDAQPSEKRGGGRK
jgi:hypothetical protein